MKKVAFFPGLLLTLGLISVRVYGQDVFEIQVYEYETVSKGEWELETHLNHVARGTKGIEGRIAPTDRQSHLSFELTRGITEEFEIAGYLLLAQRSGVGVEFAGWRVRPRIRAPEDWGLPVGLSLSTEIGFPRPQYEANSITLELRPIIEKRFATWFLSLNPGITRALRGPDTDEGFEFEPGAKISYFLMGKDHVNIGLEYYGSTGPIGNPLPASQQVHILYPTVDIFFNEHSMINIGVGFGLTNAGERRVLKVRFGYSF